MAFQTADFVGSGSYAASVDRMMNQMLRTEGVLTTTALKASERGTGANWSVDLAAGWLFIKGDDVINQGLYGGYNDAIINKAFTTFAPAANPRVDSIVARYYDSEASVSGTPQDTLFIDILVGSENAAASTSNIIGQAALPATAHLLAYAVIPVGAGSVLNAYIVDKRILSNPKIYGEDGTAYRLGVDSTGKLGLEVTTS